MNMGNVIITPDILTEIELDNLAECSVRAIVLLVENKRFKEAYNLNLLGRQMKDWVKNSVKNFDTRFVTLCENDNPLEVIKPFIRDEDYTIVLYSDTPLVTENSVLEALDYATTKNLDLCKLPRGFIVKTQNFKQNKLEVSADPTFIDKADFYTFFDTKTLSTCKQVLKERIIDFHLKNKVIINDKQTTYIECDVEIAPFVEIYSGNSLRGKTIVEEGVVLKENNTIVNSVIGQESTLVCSYLENTVLQPKSDISPFTAIIGSGNSKDNLEEPNLDNFQGDEI